MLNKRKGDLCYLMKQEMKQRLGEKIKCNVGGESYYTYMPKPLPPEPPLVLESIYPLLDRANMALGRLDGMSMILPDISLFLYMYVRKEAVLSSQIEGTQSSLSDLLLFENNDTPGALIDDVTEVSNYVAAMSYGLEKIKDGFPLSLRLIREIHGILLSKGRGKTKQPGEFRRSQNWIGGTRPGNAHFVPVSPEKLMESLDTFEKYLHDDKHPLPALIKAGLIHVQFETIHPFLDGNGRLGRLLITFLLCADGLLKSPLLYLSLYFKTNRQLYYDHLQLVREKGDWEEWLIFFLKGVIETANQAFETAQQIVELFNEHREKIEKLGKTSASMLIVHNYLQRNPRTSTRKVIEKCALRLPTVLRSFESLEKLGIVEEITGRERGRVYVYKTYLDLLSKGTEPL